MAFFLRRVSPKLSSCLWARSRASLACLAERSFNSFSSCGSSAASFSSDSFSVGAKPASSWRLPASTLLLLEFLLSNAREAVETNVPRAVVALAFAPGLGIVHEIFEQCGDDAGGRAVTAHVGVAA